MGMASHPYLTNQRRVSLLIEHANELNASDSEIASHKISK